MASNTVYVIVGANRGIGRGLVKAYVARPSTTVVAIVRSAAGVESLNTTIEIDKITVGTHSTLHIVNLDISNISNPESFRSQFLLATHLIHINTLVFSAGLAKPMTPTLATTADHLRACFEINTIASLLTFQALWPLMTAPTPKFIVLSSSMGSIAAMEPFPGGAYGPSKAAVNHIVRSLHVQMQEQGLVAVALHPGWVRTEMGEFAAREWGVREGPPVSVGESARGIVKVVDGATRESVGGRFVTERGEEIAW